MNPFEQRQDKVLELMCSSVFAICDIRKLIELTGFSRKQVRDACIALEQKGLAKFTEGNWRPLPVANNRNEETIMKKTAKKTTTKPAAKKSSTPKNPNQPPKPPSLPKKKPAPSAKLAKFFVRLGIRLQRIAGSLEPLPLADDVRSLISNVTAIAGSVEDLPDDWKPNKRGKAKASWEAGATLRVKEKNRGEYVDTLSDTEMHGLKVVQVVGRKVVVTDPINNAKLIFPVRHMELQQP